MVNDILFCFIFFLGNLRLQEMMQSMVEQRGGKLFATDDRLVF